MLKWNMSILSDWIAEPSESARHGAEILLPRKPAVLLRASGGCVDGLIASGRVKCNDDISGPSLHGPLRSGSCVESSLLPSTWSTPETTWSFATWKSCHGSRWKHTWRPFTPTIVHIQEAQWRYTTSGRGQLPTEKFPSPEPLHMCSVQGQLPPNSHRRGFCTHRPRLRCIQPRTSRESRADSPCAKSQTYLCVMYLACWTFPRQQRTRALADAAAACRFVLPVYRC